MMSREAPLCFHTRYSYIFWWKFCNINLHKKEKKVVPKMNKRTSAEVSGCCLQRRGESREIRFYRSYCVAKNRRIPMPGGHQSMYLWV